MSEKKKVRGAGKALKVVYLRNRFLYMFYRYSIVIFIMSVLMFVASSFFLYYFISRPVPPQFILVNQEGRYVDLIPVSQCFSQEEVSKFAIEALSKVYIHDYHNYADQLQGAVPYFSRSGWNDFLEQYSKSKTIEAIKENRWIVSISMEGVPVITREFNNNGACTWDLRVPILLKYIGYGNNQFQSYDAYLRISRASVISSEHGLAIQTLVLVNK